MRELFKTTVTAILVWEARLLLRHKRPRIIAVTGSVGKTTTKDAIYTALKQSGHVRKSEKSFNSEIGVALTVLGLTNAWNNPLKWLGNIIDGFFTAIGRGQYPDTLILEVGIDRPGDMARITSFITPQIVVITQLPDVPPHVEFFDSPASLQAEEFELVHALADDGVVVYNHDDGTIAKLLSNVRQQAIGFSRYAPSQYRISDDHIAYESDRPTGVSATVTHIDHTATITFKGSFGMPQLYAAAAAVAVAGQCDVPLSEAAAQLCTKRPTPGRLQLLDGVDHTFIIDDTYNSSPIAAQAALTVLHELRTKGRKIAVVGDMLELGRYSAQAHEAIGERVASVADIIVTVGIRSRRIAAAALEQGFSPKRIFQYETAEGAAEEVRRMIRAGDVILIKASQSIRAEKIVKRLMQNPNQAPDVLVRQSAEWQRR
jgi:UDP-N-acetylmuramyl pentapeptide synthase